MKKKNTQNQTEPKSERKQAKGLKRRKRKCSLLETSECKSPVLRFTPTAWAKLHSFCHHGDTEIGGFGITRPDDLILIEEFMTVKQDASMAHVAFDDEAVGDFFETQVDAGRKPEQFARIWLHTHPGDSPYPSMTDEETFHRVFGRCDWAVMFILARGGKTYARLRFNTGPGGAILIPVEIDYDHSFAPSDHQSWKEEYDRNINSDLTPYSYFDMEDDFTGRVGSDKWPFEYEPEDFIEDTGFLDDPEVREEPIELMETL